MSYDLIIKSSNKLWALRPLCRQSLAYFCYCSQSSIESMGLPVFLAYVEKLDIVPQAESLDSSHRRVGPDPVTNMLVLERPCQSDANQYLGDIVPLHQLCGPVQLTPRFGKKADNHLTAYNSLHFST